MRRVGRVLRLAGLILAVLVVASCSAGRAVPPGESLAWAGFSDTAGLEIVAVEARSALDTSVTFALRGSPGDIDRALAAAGFTEPTMAGIYVFEARLPGVDLAALVDPQTGLDRWVNSSGRTIQRKFVRGGTPEGAELIHVWAFTT
jgi:hypothetical protein